MSTLNECPPTPFLKTIEEKLQSHIRLSWEEGVALLKTTDPEEIASIAKMADTVRLQKVGNTVYFASTYFIHPTNLCELNCPFCSFYAKPGWERAWFQTPAQILEKLKTHLSKELTEVHVVGGLWRDCDLNYYQELFNGITSLAPHLHIKALTGVEYDFLAKLHGITVEEVLRRMRSWGLGSVPGGGAEILDEEIRKKIAPGKISTDEYLETHRIAHRIGLSSNISMLFNHIETEEHIATHLCKIRELQDETKGFKAFVPLKFGEENNPLGKRKNQLKKKEISLVYAVSRLMLDNIPHLKVLWNYLGVEEALRILQCGGNDLSSTNVEEKVIRMAGGVAIKMDILTMENLIRSIGRVPQLTHSGKMGA